MNVNYNTGGEAARSGDGEQAVGYVSAEGIERLRSNHDSVNVVPEKYRDSRHNVPLYARPQPAAPAPVAGDADLREWIGYLVSMAAITDQESARHYAEKIEAALAQDRTNNQ